MKNPAYILSTVLLAGIMIPDASMGATVNSTGYGTTEEAKGKRVQYIMPPKKTESRKSVIPYGDFCSRCTKYGTGNRPVNINEAVAAMKHYFDTKGLTVKEIKGRGRFLKAEIYKEDLLVDRILFDRRTGRIRSIY